MNKFLVGYRNMMNMSQTAMAHKLSITLTSYNYKERGLREFRQKEMNLIMDTLNKEYPELTMDQVFRVKLAK